MGTLLSYDVQGFLHDIKKKAGTGEAAGARFFTAF